jgi:alpha-L-rhamnosidase
MPPVRETETIGVANITTLKPGLHIVDFGVNFTGLPIIDLDLPAGTKITLRFGEILHADGSLNPMTSVCGQIKGMRKNDKGDLSPIGGPGAPEIAWQQDVYIARGGKETYRPDFTFHAFRYMEMSGIENAPTKESIRAVRLHSDLPKIGSFSCSNELLNRIQQVTLNTFVNNVISVQSDCPHRERFGYGGDIAVTSEAYLMNYDMAGFYAKTIRDWADAAREDGNFTDTVPFVGVQYCGVGWAMAHPLLLEQHYQHYGNVALIREQLPAAMRWFDLEASKRKDGLVTYGLGDHEAFKRLSGAPVTTPMFIDTARRIARLCQIAGDATHAKKYLAMVPASFDAWNKQYFDASTGRVGGNTQSELALALGFGAISDQDRNAALKQLIAQVEGEPNGPSLTTGIFGTRFLLELFSQNGRHDLAYRLATRKEFPSWGHMLENGATSLWETWKQSENTFSHNHPMFGSISAWFYRHLGGIHIADDAVAADRLIICPKPVGDLSWVKCSHQTIRGAVISNWKVGNDQSEYEIVIPPDTRAVIQLPEKAGDIITESGQPVAKSVEVLGTHRFSVGSGTYRFVLRHQP